MFSLMIHKGGVDFSKYCTVFFEYYEVTEKKYLHI